MTYSNDYGELPIIRTVVHVLVHVHECVSILHSLHVQALINGITAEQVCVIDT